MLVEAVRAVGSSPCSDKSNVRVCVAFFNREVLGLDGLVSCHANGSLLFKCDGVLSTHLSGVQNGLINPPLF